MGNINILTRNRKLIVRAAIFLLVLGNGLAWYFIVSENRGDTLTVAFLDIGQGDSIFIEAPNGNQIIFDGGPNGKILTELSKVMPFYDRSIDMIVVTNPDKDHFAGFIDLLDRYKISKIMEPGTKSNTSTYLEFEKAVEKQVKDGKGRGKNGSDKVEKILARRGMRITLDRERAIYIDILFPDRDVSYLKTNDGSIIARLVYADTSVMLTGDAPQKTEDRVVELGGVQGAPSTSLKSDILKVGHHGSRTSTGEKFVEKMAPKYAVISSGKNNKYDHPHLETLETLKKFHVTVLRTDERGTIVMKSDGHTFRAQ